MTSTYLLLNFRFMLKKLTLLNAYRVYRLDISNLTLCTSKRIPVARRPIVEFLYILMRSNLPIRLYMYCECYDELMQ